VKKNFREFKLSSHLFDRTFAAFHIPAFKWLWAGNSMSFMSRVVYIMAEGWLVLVITNSPFWVGAISGVRGATVILLSPIAGVIADRFDRRKLLMWTQLIMAVIAIALAYLTFSGLIELWHIASLTILQGIAHTINMPSRLTLTMDITGKKALLNAIAASQMGNGIVQIVAPTVAGFIISNANLGSVYIMVSASAILAILSWLRMGSSENIIRDRASPWKNLKEGFIYVWKEPTLRSLIVMALVVEAFAWSHITMLPVIARDVLNVGASGFGLLSSAAGVGLMIGTLTMASLGDIKNKGRWLVLYSLGFGFFILLFSISTWFPLSMLLIAIALAMGISCDAMLSTLLQILSDNKMRGRVVSFYGLTFGMTPMGGFGEGIIANLINAPFAVGLGAVLVILNSIRLIMQGLAPNIQIALAKNQEPS